MKSISQPISRWLLSLACCMLALPVLADNVDVADANGNVLRYTYTSGEGNSAMLSSIVSLSGESNCQIVVPASITGQDGFDHQVTTIVGNAFGARASITGITLPASLTSLGAEAFRGCTSLKSIVIPSGVTQIPSSCFYGCTALSSATLPSGITKIEGYAFQNTALQEFHAPAALTSIGREAFRGCSSLEEIDLSAATGLTSVGYYAFRDCSAVKRMSINSDFSISDTYLTSSSQIESVVFGDNCTTVNSSLLSGRTNLTSVSLGSNITSIGDNAFQNCTSLESITLPASLTSLGTEAFRGCTSLKSIVIPSGVTQIPSSCFYGCTALSSATLPSGITKIEGYAFQNTALQEFHAPAALTSIGREAFRGCSSLEEIDLSAATGLTSVGYYAFRDCSAVKRMSINSDFSISDTYLTSSSQIESVVFGDNCTTVNSYFLNDRTNLTSVSLGSNITSIGNNAFQNCTSLESITLPASLTSLGTDAFRGCTSLKSIVIPSGVTQIPSSCFYGCTALSSATLPSGITSIDSYAFQNTALQEFHAPADLTSIGRDAFSGCSGIEEIDLSAATGLTSVGSYAFRYCSAVKRVSINSDFSTSGTYITSSSQIESVVFGDNCTTVNSYFLNDRTNLTSVSLGSNITSIGNNAFQNCTSLESITLPASLTSLGTDAFSGCTSLTSIVLGTGLKTINDRAFYNCYVLSSINLGDTELENLNGSDVFYNCNALLELTLPATLQPITSSYTLRSINNLRKVTILTPSVPFQATTNFPSTTVLYVPAALVDSYKENQYTKDFRIIAIGSVLDYDITTTAGGQLQEKVEAIGEAFNVVSLKVSGPINGTDIEYLHRYMTSIVTLDMGDANIVNGGDSYHIYTISNSGIATQSGSSSYNTEVDIVGDYMFANLPLLERLVLPQGATKIGAYSIGGNLLRLTDLTLPAALEEIGDYAFVRSSSYNIYRSTALTQLTLPAGLKKIGRYAFYQTLIKDLTIPSGVTRIEDRTFNYSSLRNINLPEGLTFIGQYAFAEGSLESLTLPASVDTIQAYAFQNNRSLTGELRIPGTVKTIQTYTFQGCEKLNSIVLEEGVEAIDQYAFYTNRQLTNVSLPNTLKTIGYTAFGYCSALQSVTIPQSVETIANSSFQNCTNMRSFTFPEKVTTVSQNVLSYCDSLQSVTLAEGTTVIGESAFYNCPKLTVCNINQPTLTTIGNSAFYNTGFQQVTLPNSITSLGQSSFRDCKNLVSINIPTSIDYVPYRFVRGCSALTSVAMHDGIRNIWAEAFYGCSALPSIDMNDNIGTIDWDAFNGCTVLQVTALPTSLTTLSRYAFSSCKAITNLTMPQGVSIGDNAFQYSGLVSVDVSPAASIGSGLFSHCSSLQNVTWNTTWTTIPPSTFEYCSSLTTFPFYDGITMIDDYAFRNSGITNVTLPSTVTSIEYMAFYDCSSLASIILSETLQKIDNYAFQYCSSLESITLPDALTSLGIFAFSYCPNLKEARLGRNMNYTSNSNFDYFYQNENMELLRVFSGTVPPIGSYYAPKNRQNCVLEVPKGTEELYAAADVWKEFKEIRGFMTGDKLAAEDYALLCQFYEEMGGEGWTNKWDLTTDDRYIGKWYGVTTEGDHVKTISVAGNNISGNLKQTIFNLPELTSLNLSSNNITGRLENVLAEDFTNEKITYVNLSRNKLEGDIAPFANRLPQLTKLFLEYNRLTEISEPLSNKLIDNTSYLDYRYQFVDPLTAYGIETEEHPALSFKLGEPFVVPMNTLLTYRHNYKDHNYTGDRLYHLPRYMGSNGTPYLSANGYYHFQKNGEGQFVPSTGYSFSGWKKGDIAPYDYGGSNWWQRIVNIKIDWIDGDVNEDLTVDVLDMQSAAYYALYDSRISGQPLNYETLNANEDGMIDVRDVVLTINRILDYEEESPGLARALYRIMSEDEDAAEVSIADGMLSARKASGVAAMQLLLTGCIEDDVNLSRDMAGFSIKAKQTSQGVKVVIYNLNCETMDYPKEQRYKTCASATKMPSA